MIALFMVILTENGDRLGGSELPRKVLRAFRVSKISDGNKKTEMVSF